jgi:hypothetical protein|eukprot:COSAG01_NODE_6699_length_3538_cov_14.488805_4_plen_111_part_00
MQNYSLLLIYLLLASGWSLFGTLPQCRARRQAIANDATHGYHNIWPDTLNLCLFVRAPANGSGDNTDICALAAGMSTLAVAHTFYSRCWLSTLYCLTRCFGGCSLTGEQR